MNEEFRVDSVSLVAFMRAISVLVYYNAAGSPRRKPAWQIDVAASLRAVGRSAEQIMKGRWSPGTDERRLQQAIFSRIRWAKRR